MASRLHNISYDVLLDTWGRTGDPGVKGAGVGVGGGLLMKNGQAGSDGWGGGKKSEFWAGVPGKKNRKKTGRGREEKNWVGVGDWTPGVGGPGGCFTNVLRALQNNLAKINHAGNHIYGENFKLKLCTCAQSGALGTGTKFQLEILIRSMISAIHKIRENVLESSRTPLFSPTDTEIGPRLK